MRHSRMCTLLNSRFHSFALVKRSTRRPIGMIVKNLGGGEIGVFSYHKEPILQMRRILLTRSLSWYIEKPFCRGIDYSRFFFFLFPFVLMEYYMKLSAQFCWKNSNED